MAVPTAQELSQFVLVIQDGPGGQAMHEWYPENEFNDLEFRRSPLRPGPRGQVVFASARARDCHAEFLECIETCMSRPLPRGYGHLTLGGRGKGAKEEYCRKPCWQPYRDCEELQGRTTQEFSTVEVAVNWLKENRQAVKVGGVVLIAGIVFVAVLATGGLLVIVPAVLLSSVEGSVSARWAAVSP